MRVTARVMAACLTQRMRKAMASGSFGNRSCRPYLAALLPRPARIRADLAPTDNIHAMDRRIGEIFRLTRRRLS